MQYNLRSGGGGRPAITAAAIACLFNAGEYDSEYVPKLLEYCQQNLGNVSNQGFGHWHYAHYYYSQVLYREGGKEWEDVPRQDLCRSIVSEAGADGSWNQGYIGTGLHDGHQPDHPATGQGHACRFTSGECGKPWSKPRSEHEPSRVDHDTLHDSHDGPTTEQDSAAIEKLGDARQKIIEQLGQVIVGQNEVIEELLISLFSRGHCLLEGVPGLAKTLMISTLEPDAEPLVQPHPVHARPDAGRHHRHGGDRGEPHRPGSREFRFLEGPLFANVILADEINRTPPKTQAALLEAMQERQVTVGRVRHQLSDPFFVLATQNPIEQEGTYPLPEAQQDRFMFKVFVNYPSFDEEFEIARRTTAAMVDSIEPVLTAEEILDLQRIVREVPVSDHVIRYALSLVRQTRVGEPGVPEFVEEQLSWGAGPRAVQFLILGRQGPGAVGRPHARLVRGHPGAGQAGVAAPPGGELHGRERRRHARRA